MIAADVVATFDRPAWMAGAACRGVDPELWFPERGASSQPAREICAGCPVLDPCREWGITEFDGHGYHGGIVGGLTARERRRIRADRRRPQPPRPQEEPMDDEQQASDELRQLIDGALAPLGFPPLNLGDAVRIAGLMPSADGDVALEGWRWPDGSVVVAATDGCVWIQQREDEHTFRVLGVQRGQVIVNEPGTLGILLADDTTG